MKLIENIACAIDILLPKAVRLYFPPGFDFPGPSQLNYVDHLFQPESLPSAVYLTTTDGWKKPDGECYTRSESTTEIEFDVQTGGERP